MHNKMSRHFCRIWDADGVQGLFTVVFGFQIGVITSYWNTQAVMIAFLVTCGVVGLCAFIAFFTRLDLTK